MVHQRMSAMCGGVVKLIPLLIASGVLLWEPVTALEASVLATPDAGRLLAPERDLSNLMVGRNLVELAQEFAPRCEDDSTAGCIEEDDSDEGDTNPSQYTQHLIYCPCRKLYTRTYR